MELGREIMTLKVT